MDIPFETSSVIWLVKTCCHWRIIHIQREFSASEKAFKNNISKIDLSFIKHYAENNDTKDER